MAHCLPPPLADHHLALVPPHPGVFFVQDDSLVFFFEHPPFGVGPNSHNRWPRHAEGNLFNISPTFFSIFVFHDTSQDPLTDHWSRLPGAWKDDMKDGHGVAVFATGNRYEGLSPTHPCEIVWGVQSEVWPSPWEPRTLPPPPGS